MIERYRNPQINTIFENVFVLGAVDYVGFDFWNKGKKYTFSKVLVKRRGWGSKGRVYILLVAKISFEAYHT